MALEDMLHISMQWVLVSVDICTQRAAALDPEIEGTGN